ncbi:hypothetical protein [Salinicola sp. DM10]|uniref:hypothetical protein n=1 Tax=Salinicola sp. DM10 TaxID=2815721 RepID=UPI001A8F4B2F|nr:hypothetical protein [Salinicola sp. DM10]MCE3028599.1 hypothetical protein [Salinicola sp. DM10]
MRAPQRLSSPVQPPADVQPDGRAGFGALRAELHARCADEDLAALWAGLKLGERKAIAASAGLHPRDAEAAIAALSQVERDAIRAAIGRMSRYAQALHACLGSQPNARQPHPSRALAANARRALDRGDTPGARHWLGLIERGEP